MQFLFIPLLLRKRKNNRMPYQNQIQRHYVGRNRQQFTQLAHTAFQRINARPHCSQPDSMCRQQQILGCSRTILHPIKRIVFFINLIDMLIERNVPAHHNACTSPVYHLGIGQAVFQTLLHCFITHHNKMPRLQIHGTGCSHCRLQQDVQRLIAYRLVCKPPDRNSCQDIGYCFVLYHFYFIILNQPYQYLRLYFQQPMNGYTQRLVQYFLEYANKTNDQLLHKTTHNPDNIVSII